MKGQDGVTKEETALLLEPQAWPGLQLLCSVPACVASRGCSTSQSLGLLPGKHGSGERAAKDEIHLHKWPGAACTQGGFTNTSSPSTTLSLSRKDLSQEWVRGGGQIRKAPGNGF